MPRLIIGHVDHKSARIWTRGQESRPVAQLEVLASDGSPVAFKTINLEERHFYTGVFEISGLKPDTRYTCGVGLRSAQNPADVLVPEYGSGTFRTQTAPDQQSAFSFLLVSCNLHSLGVVTPADDAYRKLSALAKKHDARFSIHCGDQIYYDVPQWGRDPDVDEYRDTYLDAWGDCEPTAQFLTELPHYMILDDHEIIDDFACDRKLTSGAPNHVQLALATKVYREFQHIHNPQSFGSGPLYYKFDAGAARFFVFDTRTERFSGEGEGPQEMISPEQFAHFRSWLKSNRDRQLFIVTSIPFVARVRKSKDKWSSVSYRVQREKILELIWNEEARRVCFLTGDMHNSQHATVRLTGSGKGDIVVHELMSSPVNQLGKNRFDAYHPGKEDAARTGLPFSYSTDLKKSEFYTGHSNAMVISVTKSKVNWEIHRTKKTEIKPELAGSFPF